MADQNEKYQWIEMSKIISETNRTTKPTSFVNVGNNANTVTGAGRLATTAENKSSNERIVQGEIQKFNKGYKQFGIDFNTFSNNSELGTLIQSERIVQGQDCLSPFIEGSPYLERTWPVDSQKVVKSKCLSPAASVRPVILTSEGVRTIDGMEHPVDASSKFKPIIQNEWDVMCYSGTSYGTFAQKNGQSKNNQSNFDTKSKGNSSFSGRFSGLYDNVLEPNGEHGQKEFRVNPQGSTQQFVSPRAHDTTSHISKKKHVNKTTKMNDGEKGFTRTSKPAEMDKFKMSSSKLDPALGNIHQKQNSSLKQNMPRGHQNDHLAHRQTITSGQKATLKYVDHKGNSSAVISIPAQEQSKPESVQYKSSGQKMITYNGIPDLDKQLHISSIRGGASQQRRTEMDQRYSTKSHFQHVKHNDSNQRGKHYATDMADYQRKQNDQFRVQVCIDGDMFSGCDNPQVHVSGQRSSDSRSSSRGSNLRTEVSIVTERGNFGDERRSLKNNDQLIGKKYDNENHATYVSGSNSVQTQMLPISVNESDHLSAMKSRIRHNKQHQEMTGPPPMLRSFKPERSPKSSRLLNLDLAADQESQSVSYNDKPRMGLIGKSKPVVEMDQLNENDTLLNTMINTRSSNASTIGLLNPELNVNNSAQGSVGSRNTAVGYRYNCPSPGRKSPGFTAPLDFQQFKQTGRRLGTLGVDDSPLVMRRDLPIGGSSDSASAGDTTPTSPKSKVKFKLDTDKEMKTYSERSTSGGQIPFSWGHNYKATNNPWDLIDSKSPTDPWSKAEVVRNPSVKTEILAQTLQHVPPLVCENNNGSSSLQVSNKSADDDDPSIMKEILLLTREDTALLDPTVGVDGASVSSAHIIRSNEGNQIICATGLSLKSKTIADSNTVDLVIKGQPNDSMAHIKLDPNRNEAIPNKYESRADAQMCQEVVTKSTGFPLSANMTTHPNEIPEDSKSFSSSPPPYDKVKDKFRNKDDRIYELNSRNEHNQDILGTKNKSKLHSIVSPNTIPSSTSQCRSKVKPKIVDEYLTKNGVIESHIMLNEFRRPPPVCECSEHIQYSLGLV